MRRIREDEALRLILEGTVSVTGTEFFRVLVKNLSQALRTLGAWVTEYLPEEGRLRSLAFWLRDEFVDSYEYAIRGTPCQPVIDRKCLAHFPDKVMELFPDDPDLAKFDAVSYMGVPLFDTQGGLLGHLAVLDDQPMPAEPGLVEVFEIFAERAAAEYRRLRAEEQVRARERQLAKLLETAMDAILILDADLRIIRINAAGERIFGGTGEQLVGESLHSLVDPEGARLLEARMRELEALPSDEKKIWFPESLGALRRDGSPFPAEATISCFEVEGSLFHTLILRSVDERLDAERTI